MGAAVGAYDALHSGLTLQPYHTSIADDLDALSAVLVREILGNIRRNHPIHQAVRHFQYRDRATHLAGRGGCFEANVAPADDDDTRSRLEAFLDLGDIGD